MLSIDITDTEIRVVEATLSGEKIKVTKAVRSELSPNTVENGSIVDMYMLAGEITRVLTEQNIPFQTSILCINSGATLYKELLLPKPKRYTQVMLEDMIMIDMGISDSYNVTYSIVNEEITEGVAKFKVIATACPQDIVDSYILLAKQVGLHLSKIVVSSDCVSRIIAKRPPNPSQSPLLLLQIDNNFITMNIYVNNGLVTSRNIAVDPADYEEGADYLSLCLFDNVFRIIHFFGSNSDSEAIKFISYYGNYEDAGFIERILDQFNLPYAEFERPFEVSGFNSMRYPLYINNIASFYKADKRFHDVNLMDSKATREKQQTRNYWMGLLICSAALAFIVIAVTAYTGLLVGFKNNNLEALNAEYTAMDHDNIIAVLNAKKSAVDSFHAYVATVEHARAVVDFQNNMTPKILDQLKAEMLPGMEIVGDVNVADSKVSVGFTCKKDTDPTKYVEALIEQDYFQNINYIGYTREEEQIVFALTMYLKGGNVYDA